MTWLEESSEEQVFEELREQRKIQELRTQYKQLKNTSPRRRSLSPTKRPTKPRRSYRHLPMREDGSVELPVILGRGVHRIILVEIGKINPSPPFRTDDDHLYPVGYLCKRKYYPFDADLSVEKPKKFYYFCAIKESNGRPLV
jgi:hypothetical protein